MTEMAVREVSPMRLSATEIDLVKRTIALGATDEELKLFLHDCTRQGVHPLDKLIHFSKRGGRYTPITSIDFMRMRAADSGELAGNEDPVFIFKDGETVIPQSASVTVYRITQGQRYAYTATARWMEYYPGKQQGFMWDKMPQLMLGKCAEALALRKAFPKQLHGIYERAEMMQAEDVVKAPSKGGETSRHAHSSIGSPSMVPPSAPPSTSAMEAGAPPETEPSVEELFPDAEKDHLVQECGVIIKTALASKVITQKDVRNFKHTYLGDENADPNKCDVAALRDLHMYLESRFRA